MSQIEEIRKVLGELNRKFSVISVQANVCEKCDDKGSPVKLGFVPAILCLFHAREWDLLLPRLRCDIELRQADAKLSWLIRHADNDDDVAEQVLVVRQCIEKVQMYAMEWLNTADGEMELVPRMGEGNGHLPPAFHVAGWL
jgi:hypothetical protein